MLRLTLTLASALLLTPLLSGCSDDGASPTSQADGTGQATSATERREAMQAFQDVLAAGNQPLALTLGRNIVKRWPDSQQAQLVRPQLAGLAKTAQEDAEARRLAALWVYHRRGAEGDSAFIYRVGDGDAEKGGRGLRLVLRDRPDWGRDIFLLTTRGRFDCAPSCQVEIIVDDQPPRQIEAFASEPDQNPALFFEDGTAFLETLRGATRLDIAAPMQDEPGNRALFEVAGFDETRWIGSKAASGNDGVPH